jgi:hypothetical protein
MVMRKAECRSGKSNLIIRNFEKLRVTIRILLTGPRYFPTGKFQLAIFLTLIQIFIPTPPWVCGAVHQNTATLSAFLDKKSVAVGEVVWLTLDYRLPTGGRLPQTPRIEGIEGLSVLAQEVDPQQIRLKCLVDRLEPWQSAPIRLTFLDSNGHPRILTAPPVTFEVVSNLGEAPEAAQLRPIRDIIPIRTVWYSYLWWGAVGLALLALGFFIFRRLCSRRRTTALPEYRDPPHVAARRALRELESQKYVEKGMAKTHYFIFSEILRRYLEAIRKFPAAEYTTEEIVRHIQTEQDRKLIPLLQQADLVKFADRLPTPARKEADIRAALAYIRETSPRLEPVVDDSRKREALP